MGTILTTRGCDAFAPRVFYCGSVNMGMRETRVTVDCRTMRSPRLRLAPARAKIPKLTRTILMLENYWPILLFLCVAGGIGVALIIV
ncbi:MAG: hypothetical protein KGK35_11775, partial [Xanthomonadaceae bacterium]|nr:hypothetical protein [Xanthomonadaceae bacterium]